MPGTIPPPDAQLEVLTRGVVDLNPREDVEGRLRDSYEKQRPLRVKVGFDPTAPDIHLGHTVVIEKMAQFQRLGHEVIFLVGDYTARIGDPTGRNSLRPPLTDEEIEANAATYAEQCFKILDRDLTRIEFNGKWLSKLSFADVIQLAARYNVGRMLERRDFRQRFDEGRQIALHEFLYPLMQAYDSVALEADFELGGHDQIFNLNVGRHIMQSYGQRPQIVLTTGLLVGLDGTDKMSKSKGNHIGITEKPEDMFGKIMSISDDLMRAWYPMLLEDTPPEVESDPLGAKKSLAQAMVERFHDAAAAHRVREWWDAGRPATDVEDVSVEAGPLFAVVAGAGMAKSNGDARRKIQQGGVSLEGERRDDPHFAVEPGTYLLRVGKKNVKKVTVR
ncbi:MAG: tyrosine--tRNA ligase [Myxococcota bacterium]